ncbi:hypothetical protein J6P92_01000 [bacterium]|nr:hypothetical protein [bacterium]
MKILQFTPFLNNQNTQNNPISANRYPNMSYPNLKPLQSDTVSFGMRRKAAETVLSIAGDLAKAAEVRTDKKLEGSGIVPMSICQQLYKETIVPYGYFDNIMNKYFGKYIADTNNPNRIILEIKTDHKKASSVHEKLEGIAEKEKQRIEEAGGLYKFGGIEEARKNVKDLVRGCIVLRDSSKSSVRKVFQIFEEMLKDGAISKFTEVENYYPVLDSVPDWVIRGYQKDLGIKLDNKKIKAMTKFDYFSYPDLNDLKDFVSVAKKYNPNLEPLYGKDLENGYQGLHVNAELPDGTIVEIQISGHDVHDLKTLIEDYIYKKRCNKKVKNPALNEVLEPLADKKEKALQAMHANYMRFAYVGQRLLEPLGLGQKHSHTRFLTAPKPILERGLGLNQLIVTKRLGERMMRAEVS